MDFKEFIKDITNLNVPKDFAFEESEYRQRIANVRKVMDERDLDVLLVTFAPDLSYLSGYRSFGTGWYTCMVLPREGDPVLHMHQLEIGPTILTSWVKDIRGVRWSFLDGVGTELADILNELGLESKRIGLETKRPGISIDVRDDLQRALPRATFIEASDVVAQPRRYKSPTEIEYMRKSAEITNKALSTLLSQIHANMTDNQVAAILSNTMLNEGSEYFSIQPIVSAGSASSIGHTTHRRIPINTGETMIMEFGAAYQRYTSAVYHTVAIGKPSAEIVNRAKIINETLDALFEVAKPGRTCHDIARELRVGMDTITRAPSAQRIYAYAIGLGMPPTWSEDIYYIREGVELELKPGMTFHSPISAREASMPGVGFSETWLVTETGCEILTKHDRQLTVV
ncbi:MAG: aminopeptidase P family protein [Mesorhizobium sp.]|nr:MAG: aminopeptidase P family protein [Mesorhizobium sp.]